MAVRAKRRQATGRHRSHGQQAAHFVNAERTATAQVPPGGEAPAHGAVRSQRGRIRRGRSGRSASRAGQGRVRGTDRAGRRPQRHKPGRVPAAGGAGEFMRAAGLVRRIGVNLNQAVAKLNATGQRSGDLLPYAAESIRRAQTPRPGRRGSAETDPPMIGKVSPHGQRVTGLIYYLFGPGRNGEHTDPHLVAGWRHPAELEPPLRDDGHRDFRHLNGLLQQPHDRARPARIAPPGLALLRPGRRRTTGCSPMTNGPRSPARSCTAPAWPRTARTTTRSAGSRSGTPRITSTSWPCWPARTARVPGPVERLLPRRRGVPGRGAAVRAAPDRSARPDRGAPSDPRRVGESASPRIAGSAPDHAPARRQHRRRRGGQRAGVLRPAGPGWRHGPQAVQHPQPRRGHRLRGRVADDTTRAGRPGLVRRREARRGPDPAQAPLPLAGHRPRAGERFTAAERNAIWEHAARTAAGAAEQIRNVAATDPAVAADAAWAAADTLHAAAAALGSRVLRQAADSYDRAARAPYGRIPTPWSAGEQPAPYGPATVTWPRPSRRTLTGRNDAADALARLAEAIAELREAQRLAAQAAAARRAAEHLRVAMPGYVTPPSGRRTRTRASAERSQAEFPFPPGTFRPGTGSLGEAASQRAAPPVRGQGPSRLRGPAR